MSTHNICIRQEIRKILRGYPLLSVAMIIPLSDLQVKVIDLETNIRLSLNLFTHFILETPKRVFGKQCRPRSDATECSIYSAASDQSTLFALNTDISLKQ